MNPMRGWHVKKIAAAVLFSFFILSCVPSNGMAYVIGSAPHASSIDGTADTANIARILESKLVGERLSEIGLTGSEIDARLKKLSDGELHEFAAQIEGLSPGAAGMEFIALLLLILGLVMLATSGSRAKHTQGGTPGGQSIIGDGDVIYK